MDLMSRIQSAIDLQLAQAHRPSAPPRLLAAMRTDGTHTRAPRLAALRVLCAVAPLLRPYAHLVLPLLLQLA
ncbi:MAG: hypothetical protein ACK40L_19300, partial [Hydrogenophaga sp.]